MSVYNFTARLGNKKYKVKFIVAPHYRGENLGRYGVLPYLGRVTAYVHLCGVKDHVMTATSYCSTKDKFSELVGCREALGEVLHCYHFTEKEREVFWKAFAARIPIADQELAQEIVDQLEILNDEAKAMIEQWRQTGANVGAAFSAFSKAFFNSEKELIGIVSPKVEEVTTQ